MLLGCASCCVVMLVMYYQGYRVARPGEEMCRKGCAVEEQLEMMLLGMRPRVRQSTTQSLSDLLVAFTVMHPNREVEELKAYLNRLQHAQV